MKYFSYIVLLIFAISVTTTNAAYTVKCKPGTLSNELGVSDLKIILSEEVAGRALMFLSYQGKGTSHDAKEMDCNELAVGEYHLTPSGNSNGSVSIVLTNKKNAYSAIANDVFFDTVSTLNCKRF